MVLPVKKEDAVKPEWVHEWLALQPSEVPRWVSSHADELDPDTLAGFWAFGEAWLKSKPLRARTLANDAAVLER